MKQNKSNEIAHGYCHVHNKITKIKCMRCTHQVDKTNETSEKQKSSRLILNTFTKTVSTEAKILNRP